VYLEKKAVQETPILYPINTSFDLDLALDTKSKVLNRISYQNFKNRIERFKKWLNEEDYDLYEDILTINKKLVIQYLNCI